MEVRYSEYKHMVNQWSVCARQKKEGMDGTQFLPENKEIVIKSTVQPSHALAQNH